jgi:16S rRNA (cytosine1402-N4)-methyltransferase
VYVHVPVLLEAVLELLAPPAGEACLVDATLGEGGHTEAFLSRFPRLRVVGVDKDAEILRKAEARLASFGGRVRLVQSGFADFFERGLGELRPERILMDLGVSMFHFEQSGRGFSFRSDEPLDMRLDSGEGRTAAELLQEAEEGELARLLEDFGEEPRARRIAAAIVRHRERQGQVTSSGQLARIVAAAVGPEARHGRTHPATRTFQALRIAVNDELEELARALPAALRGLSEGGRMGVIAFHSWRTASPSVSSGSGRGPVPAPRNGRFVNVGAKASSPCSPASR